MKLDERINDLIKKVWKKTWKCMKYAGIGILATYGAWTVVTDISEWKLIKERKWGHVVKAKTYYLGSKTTREYLYKKNLSKYYILNKSLSDYESKFKTYFDKMQGSKVPNKNHEKNKMSYNPFLYDIILSERYLHNPKNQNRERNYY